jgi:hypothetical protein
MAAVFAHIWWCHVTKSNRGFVTIAALSRPAFGHLPVEMIIVVRVKNKIMVLGCQDPEMKSGRTTLLGVVSGER